MLATALRATGLTVGLFTSPHIHCFHERINIHGQPISDASLSLLLERMIPLALQVGASYFETATALALQAFSDACVDVEILESGVGARLDSTTAVPADMALLTPIGLDHQQWLGDSIEAITQEKAWVADGCGAFFSAPQSEVVIGVLKQLEKVPHVAFPLDLPLLMFGKHQQENAALALQAAHTICKELHTEHVDNAVLEHAVTQIQVPGRLQLFTRGQAKIWLDAAHNRHAIEALLPSLATLGRMDAILVLTRDDRSLLDVLPLLRPFTEILMVSEEDALHDSSLQACTSVQQALQSILTDKPQAKILVLGSFITVAAAMSVLELPQAHRNVYIRTMS